jgi:hypothetical protein
MHQGDFGWTINMLWDGMSMRREGWNALHKITLQRPDENSKMTQPYIYITTAKGDVVPWLATQADILAADWLQVV